MNKHIFHFLELCCLFFMLCHSISAAKRTVYITYILHGNMNYDRYVRPTIWKEFPVIYNNLLNFMDEHPDFKGQLQFSGQTLGSLLQTAPQVVDHALAIHKRGQLNFTGTFYSEPVNVNMDGETNYRCAWLGTKIVESIVGSTDGFYLQERAYHPQLPWILNHSNVSWTPVITGDNSNYPFKIRGTDGSVSVCVPITRTSIIDKIRDAPNNSLIAVEEDYEIPQVFTSTYDEVTKFNTSQKDVKVIWITVKEYIKKFGVKEERYVDHVIKAKNIEDGTYSRWTSDPLDIIVQNYTNNAMNDFRSAKIVNAITSYYYNKIFDIPFNKAQLTLHKDPLIWNIEQADLYPDIAPKFLSRDGEVTLLSKAEQYLLWAVNSDAKGWYPLYEKRRERINSFRNTSNISKSIINDAMSWLNSQIKLAGYDNYYMVYNVEPQRNKVISITTDIPMEYFDYTSGQELSSQSIYQDGKYTTKIETTLPSYGYKVIAAKQVTKIKNPIWKEGKSIEQNGIKISVDGENIVMQQAGRTTNISIDSFKVKALADMNDGKGDGEWRDAKPYGNVRVNISNGLYPQLNVERQLDWLVHMQLTFTIMDDKVLCDIHFDFPHPTIIKKVPKENKTDFNPQGLNIVFHTYESGMVGYDIPFGISEYNKPGVNYFCPLSTLFFQHNSDGLMISPQTGEQAFGVNSDKGEITIYLGSSTTSGPIRNVGLTYVKPTEIDHEPAWYSEPFHGAYDHQILIYQYKGSWKDAHLPNTFRSYTQPVYIHQCVTNNNGELPAEQSFIKYDNVNVDITTMDNLNNRLMFRFNEREGKDTNVQLQIKGQTLNQHITPYGIITLNR